MAESTTLTRAAFERPRMLIIPPLLRTLHAGRRETAARAGGGGEALPEAHCEVRRLPGGGRPGFALPVDAFAELSPIATPGRLRYRSADGCLGLRPWAILSKCTSGLCRSRRRWQHGGGI
jgi:hypothetical protein